MCLSFRPSVCVSVRVSGGEGVREGVGVVEVCREAVEGVGMSSSLSRSWWSSSSSSLSSSRIVVVVVVVVGGVGVVVDGSSTSSS